MKFKKSIATLAILGAVSLFSADINSINTLIDKINNTKEVDVKTELMQELENELKSLNEKDSAKAQELVSQKLQLPKES